jgi:hypothetical protein
MDESLIHDGLVNSESINGKRHNNTALSQQFRLARAWVDF